MSSTFVILDSSALIAQINVKDLWHKQANTVSELIERTDRKVIFPAEVLAETLSPPSVCSLTLQPKTSF